MKALLFLAALGGSLGIGSRIAVMASGPVHHPYIAEVFFNVPAGVKGDANRDGQRDAAGDEFIEIANPHDEAINLKGYVLTNRLASVTGDEGKGVRFVFPECTIGPGDVAVVFNGYRWSVPEGVGTEERAPTLAIEGMGQGWVFTMGVSSPTTALRNSGDFVLLSAPDGEPIDCVSWGEPDPPPPATAPRVVSVGVNPKGSVQRLTPGGALTAHVEIDGASFSPGIIPAGKPR